VTDMELNTLCDTLGIDRPAEIHSMPFGKHKGKRFSDIPAGYLKWTLENLTLHDDLRMSIKRYLRNRKNGA
jgi:putative quorum-sensing-regulated virulence factor